MSARSDDFSRLTTRIARHRPRRLPGRRWLARAVVAVVLREDARLGPCVLVMRRAQRSGDPWSGHMSFPGGRIDKGDRSGFHAAIREALEETGLQLREDEYVGRLSDVVTRRHERPVPMLVSPFVFRLAREPSWALNHEVVETLWVPLDFLADAANRSELRWRVGPLNLRLPAYVYEGRTIWGLTLLMLKELIRLYRDTGART
ncbi:MAG TPA: CoA pyrophosphatase [Nevskiales bacterium]|nr:CoA pyrophosphatase [Nevskiales bacterium]